IPWASLEPALLGRQGQALSKRTRSCPAAQAEPRSGGSTCGVTMLPLSTIEGQETEEVQTKPPEKGALPSEVPDDLLNNPSKTEGTISAKLLPICPLPTVCFAYYLETDDSDSDSQFPPEPSKPGSNRTSPSKPGAEYEEIQAWECPLCCLSILCLS
ncbi:hypothetical protein EI555_007937, partial [Monodon monoceros]